jgi:hypothetical protein
MWRSRRAAELSTCFSSLRSCFEGYRGYRTLTSAPMRRRASRRSHRVSRNPAVPLAPVGRCTPMWYSSAGTEGQTPPPWSRHSRPCQLGRGRGAPEPPRFAQTPPRGARSCDTTIRRGAQQPGTINQYPGSPWKNRMRFCKESRWAAGKLNARRRWAKQDGEAGRQNPRDHRAPTTSIP